jgi:outer membrane protein assembly factor BamA
MSLQSERPRSVVLVLVLVLASALTACGAKPAPVAAAKPAVPEAQAVPPCPESILPGGDPLESAAFEGMPVVRMCLVGGSEASRKSAERVTLLHAGDTLTGNRVRADLDGLMKLGIFDDVSAFGLRVQQGASAVVFYSVHDRPRVADIAFEGAKVLGDTALVSKLPIAKGSPYDPLRVSMVAQAVRDEYHLRGYEACRVVLVTEPVPMPNGAPSEVRVRIKVDEGPLWRLAKLEFRGNKKVSEADLRKAAGLTVGQPFVKDEIERASLVLSSLLYDRGLIAMRIQPEQGVPDASGNVAFTFVIEEGDVHTVSALHVTKLGAPLEKEILEKVIKTRPKQVFSRGQLVEDIARMKAFFTKRGQEVEIEPETNVDAAKHSIDVTLAVTGR